MKFEVVTFGNDVFIVDRNTEWVVYVTDIRFYDSFVYTAKLLNQKG